MRKIQTRVVFEKRRSINRIYGSILCYRFQRKCKAGKTDNIDQLLSHNRKVRIIAIPVTSGTIAKRMWISIASQRVATLPNHFKEE